VSECELGEGRGGVSEVGELVSECVSECECE